MSLEWDVTTIGELCSNVSSGGTPKSTNEEYYGGNIPWLNTKEINFNRIYDTEKHITNEGFKNSAAKWVKKDSVIVAMYGATAAKVAMNMVDLTTNQACCNLTIDKSLANPKFVYYYLYSNYERLLNLASGAAQQNLNSNIIKEFPINIPSLNVQNEIVNLLSTIDDKIELNQKVNKNLYNIIEARFKHYVKDFSNLDKVVLSDYCNDIIRGFNSKYVEKSNLINLNQKVNKGDILEKQYFKYLNDDIEVPKEKFAKRKDVLLNSLGDGTLGRVHYYNENTDNVIIDQHITIIRSDENKLPSSYIYQYLKCGAGQYHLNSLISGSTGMLMLNISHIRNLELPILPQKELFEFDNFAKDLFDKISSNTKEIEKLQKLRDTLLPKLMSGEIDVSKINCDLKIIIRKIYIKSSKLFLWRYLSENKNYIKNTKSNETLLKSRTIYKINKFLAKFNARYRYYRQ
ncbi:restriction endonuclease subunit S [uncultured Methanobrevibacter sp.]|uniref:restriction endonuclease subunit S n=1 Tax=uncultured Methanobrevibacter sp. TaxID=253161 RepID=UPI00258B67C7|nr:restriction endonuclease subunit S [uncultured Methanobrevibacter sp.]